MSPSFTRRSTVQLLAAGAALAAGSADAAGVASPNRTSMSAKDVHPRKRVAVLDSEMSYVDVGKGDPIVFLHGNPTWSYLWRNVIPGVAGLGRCLAPDLVGMGQSKPFTDSDYSFDHHARYLDAWFDAVGATRNVTLVIHDWGSVLGFNRARRFPDQIKAVAYMEAIVMDRTWAEFGPFESTFRTLRTPAGEGLVLDQNLFVEQVLPQAILRKLTDEELNNYRAPFKTRESRWPTLAWPRQIPVDGEPKAVADIVKANGAFMATAKFPKAFINADPGTMPPRAREFCRTWPNQSETTIKGVHYVQEDAPDEIAAEVRKLIRRA